MRAIDADALMKDVRENSESYFADDFAEFWVNRQPTIQSEPHWIPVTERLPKSKEEDLEYPTVLICFENEEIMLGCFYESTKEWGTGEYFDKKCNPIAWMPKPEPYKGVTE